MQADEYHTVSRTSLPKDKFSEVLMRREKHRQFPLRHFENYVVGDARLHLGYLEYLVAEYLVAVSSETLRDLTIDAFITEGSD